MSWYDKCYWERCEGCQPCAEITPPSAAEACPERDTWKPWWQMSNSRIACEQWSDNHDWGALRDGRTVLEACSNSSWAQKHCPFTCCVEQLRPDWLRGGPDKRAGGEEKEVATSFSSSESQESCPKPATWCVHAGATNELKTCGGVRGHYCHDSKGGAGLSPCTCDGEGDPTTAAPGKCATWSDQGMACEQDSKEANKEEQAKEKKAKKAEQEQQQHFKDGKATFAVGFLTRGDLPLFEKVWGPFFSHCNGNSAMPIVHTQANPSDDKEATARHALAKRLEKYGGVVVPHDQSVYGEMRFSFNMVSAMFSLVRVASKQKAPNGKYADWIHFASERCAPIRPCAALQYYLDSNPGISHLEASPSTSVGVQRIDQAGVPAEFKPLVMSSQWGTLWMKDAIKLADDEDRLSKKWGPKSHPAPVYGININPRIFVYGAPDEWLWHTELAQVNATVKAPGLTNVYWSWSCQHADNTDGASPCAYLDYQQTIEGCTRAQNMGYYFGRKYGNANALALPLPHQTPIEEGLTECRSRNVKPKHEVDFVRFETQYPRTRGEAMVQAGLPYWSNSSGLSRKDAWKAFQEIVSKGPSKQHA